MPGIRNFHHYHLLKCNTEERPAMLSQSLKLHLFGWGHTNSWNLVPPLVLLTLYKALDIIRNLTDHWAPSSDHKGESPKLRREWRIVQADSAVGDKAGARSVELTQLLCSPLPEHFLSATVCWALSYMPGAWQRTPSVFSHKSWQRKWAEQTWKTVYNGSTILSVIIEVSL